MRWICCVSGMLLVFGLAGSAAGLEPCGGPAITFVGCGGGAGYGGAGLGGPFYGMVPGCCRHPPSCCDNAWAGYCEEKARWRAFWYRLGAPMESSHCGAMPAMSSAPAASAHPAVPSVPAPTSEPATLEKSTPLPPIPEPAAEETTGRSGRRLR